MLGTKQDPACKKFVPSVDMTQGRKFSTQVWHKVRPSSEELYAK